MTLLETANKPQCGVTWYLRWWRIAAVVTLGLLVAGCQAGVNQELVATATVYPLRSPVAGRVQGTPDARGDQVSDALATGEAGRRAGEPAAATAFSQAIARDPSLVAAFLGRGMATMAQAQGELATYQRALDDFNRALSLDAASVQARLGRARVYLDRFQFRGDSADLERARTDLDVVIAAGSSEEANLLLARFHIAAGQLEDAIRLIEAPVVRRIDESAVSDEERAITRASLYLSSRQTSEAIDAGSTAIEVSPEAVDGYRLLAEAHLQNNDPEQALEVVDELLARHPDDGPGLFLRAAALARLGRASDAETAIAVARDRLAASPVYLARITQISATLSPNATPS